MPKNPYMEVTIITGYKYYGIYGHNIYVVILHLLYIADGYCDSNASAQLNNDAAV